MAATSGLPPTTMQTTPNQESAAVALAQPVPSPADAPAGDYAPRQTGNIGLLGFITAAIWVIRRGTDIAPELGAVLLLAAAALPMALYDVLVMRTHRGTAAGLLWDRQHTPNLRRVGIKLVGFLGTVGLAVITYLLFVEYRKDNYQPAFEVLSRALWGLLPLSPLYFWWVDGKQEKPEDGYFHFGLLLLGRWRKLDKEALREYALGWLVKVFYLPLMLGFLINDVRFAQDRSPWNNGFYGFADWCTNLIYTVDLLFGTLGYMMTFRVLNSHIRSTQRTALGWASAIMCYQPFWSVFDANYLSYSTVRWNDFLPYAQYPVVHVIWGCAVLFCEAVFAYATVCFGLRFSNLTHRGIIRTGLYSLTKHPAYIAKIASYILVAVPFVTVGRHPLQALRQCILLCGVALIYRVRAITEERHLMSDPSYRAYAEEIAAKHARWWARLGLNRVFGRRTDSEAKA